MPRPATVTTLLRIVEEQSATIRALTEALACQIQPSVTYSGDCVPYNGENGVSVTHDGRKASLVAEMALQPSVSAVYELPERVVRMIEATPGLDDELRAYLWEMADKCLSEGMEEALVVQMIAQGEQ